MTGDKKDKALHRSWDLLQSKSMNVGCAAVFSSAEQLSDHSDTHYTISEGQEIQYRSIAKPSEGYD
jgi:hypothetical protein